MESHSVNIPSKLQKSGRIRFVAYMVLVMLDQVTKTAVSHHFKLYESVKVCHGYLGIQYVMNTGLTLGLFSDTYPFPPLITLLAIVMVTLIFRFYQKMDSPQPSASYAYLLMMSGYTGNFIDMMLFKGVRDFIIVFKMSIANLADVFIYTGYIFLIDVVLRDGRVRTYYKKPLRNQLRDIQTLFRFGYTECRRIFGMKHEQL